MPMTLAEALANVRPLIREPLVSHEVIIELHTLFRVIDRTLTEEKMGTVIKQDPDSTPLSTVSALLRKWHEAKYGIDMPNPVLTQLKAGTEMGELCEAFGAYVKGTVDHADCHQLAMHVAEEAADVVIVLWHLVRSLGLDLAAEILHKIQTIFDRLEKVSAKPGPPELVTVWDEDVGQAGDRILKSLEGV